MTTAGVMSSVSSASNLVQQMHQLPHWGKNQTGQFSLQSKYLSGLFPFPIILTLCAILVFLFAIFLGGRILKNKNFASSHSKGMRIFFITLVIITLGAIFVVLVSGLITTSHGINTIHSHLKELKSTAKNTLYAARNVRTSLDAINRDLLKTDTHCDVDGTIVSDVRISISSLSIILASFETLIDTVSAVLQQVDQVVIDQAAPVAVWFPIGYCLLAVVLLSALCSVVMVACWPLSLAGARRGEIVISCLCVFSICGAGIFTVCSVLLFLGFFIALVSQSECLHAYNRISITNIHADIYHLSYTSCMLVVTVTPCLFDFCIAPFQHIASLIPRSSIAKISVAYFSECEAINQNIIDVMQTTSNQVVMLSKFMMHNVTFSDTTLLQEPRNATLCRSSVSSVVTALPELVVQVSSLMASLDLNTVCASWRGVLEDGLCRHVFLGGYALWLSLLGVAVGFVLILSSICVMRRVDRRGMIMISAVRGGVGEGDRRSELGEAEKGAVAASSSTRKAYGKDIRADMRSCNVPGNDLFYPL